MAVLFISTAFLVSIIFTEKIVVSELEFERAAESDPGDGSPCWNNQGNAWMILETVCGKLGAAGAAVPK